MKEPKPDNLKFVIAKSNALAAIGVVLLINFVFAYFNPFGKTTLSDLPKDHSWISWTTTDFVNQPVTPDIVYLGSSLLLHPLTMLDAHHLNKTVDYVDYHRSVYTEDRLGERMGVRKPVAFNFAMPGGMISDDWIITEAMVNSGKKPKVIVLGTCARDFMDCKVRCPGVMPTFKYLSKAIDMQPVLDLALPNLTDRTDFVIGKIAYLWDVKPAVQELLRSKTRDVLSSCGITNGAPRFTPAQLDELLTADMSAELERGMMVEEPDKERPFADNTAEYLQRYKHRHEKLFAAERQFFERLLATARANDIKVIVVNMPLTSLNVKLMPPGTYDEYLETVQTLAHKYGAVFENFNDDTRFPSSLFYDTVHMNSVGGRRFVDALVDVMLSDKVCLKKLAAPASGGIAAGGSPPL
jgi:hypothetical protein